VHPGLGPGWTSKPLHPRVMLPSLDLRSQVSFLDRSMFTHVLLRYMHMQHDVPSNFVDVYICTCHLCTRSPRCGCRRSEIGTPFSFTSTDPTQNANFKILTENLVARPTLRPPDAKSFVPLPPFTRRASHKPLMAHPAPMCVFYFRLQKMERFLGSCTRTTTRAPSTGTR